MNKLFTKLIRRLKAQTPAKWRKIGNLLLVVGTTSTVPADLLFNRPLALSLFIISVIGRGLVEFTTDEPA
jgi:hypothetical protein